MHFYFNLLYNGIKLNRTWHCGNFSVKEEQHIKCVGLFSCFELTLTLTQWTALAQK